MGSDYFQNKLDVTRMRCTRKYLNCTAHAIDDQNNGRWVSANQPMVEHRPHAIQLYLDQWIHHIRRYDVITPYGVVVTPYGLVCFYDLVELFD